MSSLRSKAELPGNTLSGLLFSIWRASVRAVTLNICLGAKFTPSFTWKLKPPAVAPEEEEHDNKADLKWGGYQCAVHGTTGTAENLQFSFAV